MNATDILRELAEPWSAGDRVKCGIDRAAKRAGLSYVRAREIWYGNARRIEAGEYERLKSAYRRKLEHALQNSIQDVKLQIAQMESRLRHIDADFHSDNLDFLRQAIGKAR